MSHWDAYDPIGVLYVSPSPLFPAPCIPEFGQEGTHIAKTHRGNKPQELEADLLKSFKVNVVANIHLFNLFMPLILKGQVRKVITLSTGSADLDPIRLFDSELGPGYAISKAATNVAVAKFSAQYRKDGVLFMSICPGVVETGHHADGMCALLSCCVTDPPSDPSS